MARAKSTQLSKPKGTAPQGNTFANFAWGGGRTPIWMGLGTDVEGAVTSRAAIERAGLNWDVKLEPLYREVHTEEFAEQRGILASVRDDTDEVLGYVGPDYGVVQNREGFDVLDPLVDQGLARYARAGALRGGRDVYVQIAYQFTEPGIQEIYADLGILPFGTYINNHTGNRRAQLGDTPICIVCSNTFTAAGQQMAGSESAASVRHNRNAGERLVAMAQRIWGGVIERNLVLAKTYKQLRAKRMDEAVFLELVGRRVLGPTPKENSADHVIERYAERQAKLLGSWRGDALGVSGNETAYDAWMAVTETLDHDPQGMFRETKDLVTVAIGGRADRKVEVWEALKEWAGPPKK